MCVSACLVQSSLGLLNFVSQTFDIVHVIMVHDPKIIEIEEFNYVSIAHNSET
jgi:hypothetical protein